MCVLCFCTVFMFPLLFKLVIVWQVKVDRLFVK